MISTYAELQTAVDNWLHRDDLTARVPDFIQMGEAMLNRRLRTVDMETRAVANASTSSRYFALPVGFLEMQSLVIQDPLKELVYIEPSQLRDNLSALDSIGQPSLFTIKDEIEFDCIPDTAYALEMHYFKRYDIASDSSNWLLTNYPDLYIYAAVSSAAFFVIDDPRLATAKGLMNEGIEEINNQEHRKRGSQLVEMRVDDGITAFGGFNIQTGA